MWSRRQRLFLLLQAGRCTDCARILLDYHARFESAEMTQAEVVYCGLGVSEEPDAVSQDDGIALEDEAIDL